MIFIETVWSKVYLNILNFYCSFTDSVSIHNKKSKVKNWENSKFHNHYLGSQWFQPDRLKVKFIRRKAKKKGYKENFTRNFYTSMYCKWTHIGVSCLIFHFVMQTSKIFEQIKANVLLVVKLKNIQIQFHGVWNT